ncbi:MAG TPA: bifunctional DNA primase/polymerase [Gemmataceae bacterium]|nr:bifunctional DNA primase/polymerase [Gemmataceae bacterium]
MSAPSANGTPTDTCSAARYYLSRGYAPLPLPARRKGPVIPDWPHFRVTPDEIDRYFSPNGNIGLLLGAASHGLVDVDLDSPEAIRAAPLLLPPTGMVTGRESAPTSHWWYVVTDDPPAKASTEFNDPTPGREDGLVLELRSSGGQTITPPSVYPAEPDKDHPNPERCVWHRHDEPDRIAITELLAAVGAVAAAALLGRYWTRRRNAMACALSGGLIRAGWTVERVEAFIAAVCAANGQDDDPPN